MNNGFGQGFSKNNLGLGGGFNFGFYKPPGGVPLSGLLLHLDAGNATSYPGSGNTWFDLATNPAANDATLVNTPTFSSNNGGYFNFAKASSESATVSGTNVVPSAAYTKAVWFNLTDTVSDNNLVSSATGGHFMFFGGSTKMYCGHANWTTGLAYQQYPSTMDFSAGVWYHAVLTYTTADGMKLYINGVLDSTYTANKTAHTGDGSTNIGRFGAGNFLNGNIAAVLTYNRAISATEALDLYNATKSRFGLETSLPCSTSWHPSHRTTPEIFFSMW